MILEVFFIAGDLLYGVIYSLNHPFAQSKLSSGAT